MSIKRLLESRNVVKFRYCTQCNLTFQLGPSWKLWRTLYMGTNILGAINKNTTPADNFISSLRTADTRLIWAVANVPSWPTDDEQSLRDRITQIYGEKQHFFIFI